MAPSGRLTADQAGAIHLEPPAETAPDSMLQLAQEADSMQESMQEDYTMWQTPPQLDANGRQTATAYGPALSPAVILAASHDDTDATAADPSHHDTSTSYMEGIDGPDYDAHLAQCTDHLRAHWPAIIPILENLGQHTSLTPPPDWAPVIQAHPLQHADRGTPSAAQGLSGVRIGEAANPGPPSTADDITRTVDTDTAEAGVPNPTHTGDSTAQ